MSLIDALVALVILSLAIIGVSQLSSSTLESNRLSRRLVGGLHLGQAKLEEIRALDHANVVSGTDGPLAADGADSGDSLIYSRAWTVADDTPAPGLKQLVVNVSWTDKHGTDDVVLRTLVIDR